LHRLHPRRVAAAFVAVAAVILASLLTTPAASASTYGYVYISAPTWLANCKWGDAGKVTGMFAGTDNWSTGGFDWGDDLVYARVRLGEYQSINYQAFCNKWPGYWQPGVAQMIRPTRNNQTVWVGPAGVRYN